MAQIEETILSNLLANESFTRVAMPFLKPEYFQEKADVEILNVVQSFFNKHNRLITKEILNLELKNVKGISDTDLEKAFDKVKEFPSESTDTAWLIPATEAFCRKRSVYLGIMEAIQILDGSSKLTEDAIPKLLADAINVNFDSSVGHNYLEDASARFDQYQAHEDKISFGIPELDRICSGGMGKKTLTSVGAQCVHPDTMVRIRFS